MRYLLFVLLLPALCFGSDFQPTGTHTWRDTVRQIDVGAMGALRPLNYQEDADTVWKEIKPDWLQIDDTTWVVEQGIHKCYLHENGQTYYVRPYKEKRRTIGLRTESLVWWSLLDSSYHQLEQADPDSIRVKGIKVIFYGIFTGIDKVVIYDNWFYSEQYYFHQEARKWLTADSGWVNGYLGVMWNLDLDSLQMQIVDETNQPMQPDEKPANNVSIRCKVGNDVLIQMAPMKLNHSDSDTLPIVMVYRQLLRVGTEVKFVELFDFGQTVDWPEGTIWHNLIFGSTTGYGSGDNIEGTQRGMHGSPASDGVADSICGYLSNSVSEKAFYYILYRYSITPDRGYYIAKTDSMTIPTVSYTWYSRPLLTNPDIDSDSTYIITVLGEGGTGSIMIAVDDATGCCTVWDQSNSWATGNPPPDPLDPWGEYVGEETSYELSIYCYYHTGDGEEPEENYRRRRLLQMGANLHPVDYWGNQVRRLEQ